MAALGERFRIAREARGLTLAEVSEQTRIRSVYLAAIEEEQWDRIGAAVYVRGFIRTYASFLKLDVEHALREYAGSPAVWSSPEASEEREEAMAASASAAGKRSLAPWLWTAGVLAVLLVAYLTYSLANSGQPGASVAFSSPGASPSPAALIPGPGTLLVTLSGTSWLRVTVDGNVSMVGTFPVGTQRAFRGKHVTVRVGNAAAVTLNADGKNVGPLGGAGVVVERTFTL